MNFTQIVWQFTFEKNFRQLKLTDGKKNILIMYENQSWQKFWIISVANWYSESNIVVKNTWIMDNIDIQYET